MHSINWCLMMRRSLSCGCTALSHIDAWCIALSHFDAWYTALKHTDAWCTSMHLSHIDAWCAQTLMLDAWHWGIYLMPDAQHWALLMPDAQHWAILMPDAQHWAILIWRLMLWCIELSSLHLNWVCMIQCACMRKLRNMVSMMDSRRWKLCYISRKKASWR